MNHFKRTPISTLIALAVLCFAVLCVPLGAQAESSTSDDAVSAPSVSSDDGQSAAFSPGEQTMTSSASQEPATSSGSGDDESMSDSSEAVEFVYVEKNVVAVSEAQNIVIGLHDADAAVSSATLELVRSDTQQVETLSADSAIPGAVLFSKTYTDDNDAATYMLSELMYVIDGKQTVVDFGVTDFNTVSVDDSGDTAEVTGDVDQLSTTANDSGQAPYAFDVVNEELASALDESSEQAADGVSAIAIKDDGSMVGAGSVDEALQIADSDGIVDAAAGDSVVVPEGLGSDEDEVSDSVSTDEDDVSETTVSVPNAGSALVGLFGTEQAFADVSPTRENYLIVAIDPGHGGYDSGATGNGLLEKDVNLSIAEHFADELNTYSGVTPYLTRSGDYYVGLSQRVQSAVSIGADVFVSVHCNAGGGRGAEVYVPNDSSYLNSSTHVVGSELGSKILSKISDLGLRNRGVKTRNSTDGSTYSDGYPMDYYSVIRNSRLSGIPGIIVEHAFVDSSDSAYLDDDASRTRLGVADATGVAEQYGLLKDSTAQSSSLISAQAHVSNVGWEGKVYDQKVAGTTGKSLGLEAFRLDLQNQAAKLGGVTYRAYVGSSWQDWVSNGETSGTTGESTPLQAIQVQLTGSAADEYDVYYRVHVSDVGWLGWAKNGMAAGSIGQGHNAEALEIVLVDKDSDAPGNTQTPYMGDASLADNPTPTPAKGMSVSYRAHVQDYGWMGSVSNGKAAGTTGQSLRLEALRADLVGSEYSGDIQTRMYVEGSGWQDWTTDVSGTTGRGLRTEAVQMQLTGDVARHYDVYYRVHVSDIGWMGWAKDGEKAGTADYGNRVEAVEVRLVEKGAAAPGSTSDAFRFAKVSYQAHVQDVGWQSWVADGDTAGTTGQSLRCEALRVNLASELEEDYPGSGIQYKTYIEGSGWETSWRSDGGVSGATGRGLRTEAVQMQLTGDVAKHYDVYYRVHVSDIGWMGWAKDGEKAGTADYGNRIEAVEVRLVEKGGAAPGSTSDAFRQATDSSEQASNPETSIMGSSLTTPAQMAAFYNSKGKAYPSGTYASKGASSISEFCQILYEEANAEGVRAEVLYSQAMLETGWLQFGGSVKAEQCNFGGLGSTGSGVSGATFPDVRTGLRAQTQHLKAYASTSSLNNACVDPRFGLVRRGVAPTLEDLDYRWAMSDSYGESIARIMSQLLQS